jgi:hypothetical protein
MCNVPEGAVTAEGHGFESQLQKSDDQLLICRVTGNMGTSLD